MRDRRPNVVLLGTAAVQGLYFFVTGVWPFLSLSTFLRVTGPKTDIWLLRTVAVLVVVNGLVLLIAAARGRISGEVVLLAVGSAIALAGIDFVYVGVGRIPPIYLLDALAEVIFVLAWLVGLWLDRRASD